MHIDRVMTLAPLVLLLAGPAWSQVSSESDALPIAPRAVELVQAMSDYLGGLSEFGLEAEESYDEIDDWGQKITLTNVRAVGIRRPNKFVADVRGDTLNRTVWYDGSTVSILSKEHNVYGSMAAPSTIDAFLDELADNYDVVLPLGDLIYSDVSPVLDSAVFGRYVGLHHVGERKAHHLAFTTETLEWQIWIDAGEHPLPLKLVITYFEEPGEPQYSAIIRKWNVAPKLNDALFVFEAPEGAEKIEVSAIAPALSRNGVQPE